MKWLRILAVCFERTFEYRLRSLIWILLPILNNFMVVLFWTGAGMYSSTISTYYILMTITGSLTSSHVEYEVSEEDIKQGQLVNYLTKPISYYWVSLVQEVPYRILQTLYASILVAALLLFFPGILVITLNPLHIPLVILIFVLGYLMSFTFKMSLAYLSFWFKDISSVFELVTIASIIFSGGVMPIIWYPHALQIICRILPFAYNGYFITTALEGSQTLGGLIGIITVQALWLGLFALIHKQLWKRGLREFSAVGQ